MGTPNISKIDNHRLEPLPGGPATQPASPATSAATVDFSHVLAGAKRAAGSSNPGVSRWQSLGFLANHAASRVNWPWLQTGFDRTINRNLIEQMTAVQSLKAPANALSALQPMALSDYPRPPADNGQGIHWIPTVEQTPEVVDKFVDEAVSMGMKWVVFLNEGVDATKNDYLVNKLVNAGIEPIMRIYTPGLTPIMGNIKEMVQHYGQMGVKYFQLYNEPNLMVETGGQYPNVNHYLDLWAPAARQVIEGGGLPGIGALSPQGEMDDRDFLRQALTGLKERGMDYLLNRSWLAMHNYTGPRPLDDQDGFMRFKQYHNIIQQTLNRELPIIGTEGGTHITTGVDEAKQVDMVTNAYRYMHNREPYNFAYTYWIIANGHDTAWNEHALFKPEGPTALAQALKKMNGGHQ
jgi:hypothetical protein